MKLQVGVVVKLQVGVSVKLQVSVSVELHLIFYHNISVPTGKCMYSH